MSTVTGKDHLLKNTILAVVLGSFASILASVIGSIMKYLVSEYHVVHVMWSMYLFFLPVLIPVIGLKRCTDLVRVRRPVLQVTRAMLPLLTYLFMAIALIYVPLAQATATAMASPMLLMILSVIVLNERIDWRRWVAIVCGFAGVLIILQPTTGSMHWAALLPLGTGLCVALTLLTNKILSHDSGTLPTLFYSTLFGLVILSPVLPFYWQSPSSEAWLLMAGLGLCFGLSNYMWLFALRLTNASILAPTVYLRIVGAAALGFIVFGEIPTIATIIGASVIVAAGLYSLRRARIETNRKRVTQRTGHSLSVQPHCRNAG